MKYFRQTKNSPRLLLNAEGIARLKERIARAPWAKSDWEGIRTDAQKRLAEAIDLPPRGGNWSHNYVCPTHGARLKRGKQIGPWQWEHICPNGPHVLRGNAAKATLDFDGNAISNVHSDFTRQIINAGLIYQMTRDEAQAKRAKEIVLAYADKYLSYPLHDNQGKLGKGGRIASQSLTEASWIIEYCQGADLVWETLSDAEKQKVAEKLLRPALETIILPSKLMIHNIQCRHNSAIGLTGYLLEDPKLVAIAIDDPKRGFRQQMEQGVLADGMWLEGSGGYHFFTIEGVLPLTESSRNCGLDLYASKEGEKLRQMFDAPLTAAMPNFVLPDFNDSNEVPLRAQASLYELGYARYKKPEYAALLAKNERRGRMSLLFGVPDLPTGTGVVGKSRNLTASGYAILQQGATEKATWVCLKYGPHGGGHGHPDKNHFILYSRGDVIAPDGGTHAYGSPLHNGWDKATAAHNTLIVDEKSQASSTGKCLAFGSENGIDFAMTDAGPIYEGVRFVRSAALLSPDLLIFLDQVRCNARTEPPILDLAYHQLGEWADLPTGEPWTAPNAPGYEFLKSATLRKTADAMTLQLRDKASKTTLTIAAGEPTEIITGNGIRKSTEDLVPMLLLRRRALQTAYLWAISLTGAPVTLKLSPVKDMAGKTLLTSEAALAEISDGKGKWRLLANPEQKAVSATSGTGAEWRSSAPLAVQRLA